MPTLTIRQLSLFHFLIYIAVFCLLSTFGKPTLAQQSTGSIPSAAGTATTFKSPKGFSITVPSGWMVASKDQSEALRKAAQPFLSKLGGANLDHMALLAFDTNSRSFLTNINVVLSRGRLEPTEENKGQLRSIVDKTGQAVGKPASDVSINIEPFAGRQALVSRYTLELNGLRVHQMQIALAGTNQTYIITCSISPDEAAHYEPIFKSIIGTIQIDQGFENLPDWFTSGLIGAGVGGIIGAVFTLIKKRANRS